MTELTIDVVSDVVCPWCFIGKHHLDRALNLWRAEQPQCAVAVRWHPFFLNPDTPESGEPYRPFLEKKFGGPEKLAEIWERVSAAGRSAGIDFAFEKIELRANTLNAHRLIHYAQKVGADGTAVNKLIEGLFAAQFLEGRHLGDRAVLAAVAGECGMDRDAVQGYLDSMTDADEVRAAAGEMQRMGIGGVPFFIFNKRLAASGAQPPDALLQAMREAAQPQAT
ncbi:MAG: DsbA family oxidoreductase [Sulfuritalea sp.]|jgi:predicted DsbA family dithiol-disulfide isomerase|nr:DsbA family oxidoreductase [Sulfuritalea sp.]